jgi:hypothetical protein
MEQIIFSMIVRASTPQKYPQGLQLFNNQCLVDNRNLLVCVCVCVCVAQVYTVAREYT